MRRWGEQAFTALFGVTRPFDDVQPSRLYPNGREQYLAAFARRLDEAIDLLRRSLDQDPLSASAYYNLAMALNAARTPIPKAVKEPLKRLPE